MTGIYKYDFEIASSSADSDAINLQDLDVSYPKTAFQPYAGVIDLEDNSAIGVGLPSVVWNWSVLAQAARDVLRTYCTGSSSQVWIRTRTNDNSAEFKKYQAKMIWPSLSEDYDSRTRASFAITFRNMIEASS